MKKIIYILCLVLILSNCRTLVSSTNVSEPKINPNSSKVVGNSYNVTLKQNPSEKEPFLLVNVENSEYTLYKTQVLKSNYYFNYKYKHKDGGWSFLGTFLGGFFTVMGLLAPLENINPTPLILLGVSSWSLLFLDYKKDYPKYYYKYNLERGPDEFKKLDYKPLKNKSVTVHSNGSKVKLTTDKYGTLKIDLLKFNYPKLTEFKDFSFEFKRKTVEFNNSIVINSALWLKKKPFQPPLISINDLSFSDKKFNNNRIIDVNEQSQISFQLKNTGKGSAYGIVISLSTEQTIKGISYQKEYKIDELAPNEEKQIVIPITSDFNTENANVKFIIKTKEANGFDAPDEIIHVETAKFLNPLVSVVDYNFSSEKGGIAKLGEVINLNFAVQNKGQGEAKNVKIVCTLPPSNVFAAGETEFNIPLLKPNESKVINFDFFPNRIYKQNNIPVTIDITESYGKYGESKTYTVQLNTELKQQNEIIVQGTKQESIEIKSVSLLSDIDKNLPIANGNNTNSIAVIIGNSNYANTKSVAYAISDAQSMKNYLINVLGFKEGNILFKENATLGDFNTLFGTKENQKGRLANTIKENLSDVFIFYAGHGAPGLKDNKGYFVPVECNPNYVENSGYSLDVFYQNLA